MAFTHRILLAEDNDVNARLVVAVLEQVGYEVTVAADGVQAVALCETGAFDLVLMDVHMPELCGIEATKRIRGGGAETRGVTILAMTAEEDSVMRKQCADAGMDGYVAKPIDLAELKAQIAEYLGLDRRIA